MKVFYDVLGGYHNLTGEYLPCSLSMMICTDGAEELSRVDLFLPVIYGSPALIAMNFAESHGFSQYYNWEETINDAVMQCLTEAIEKVPDDNSEVTIVAWDKPEWLPIALRTFKCASVSYMIGRMSHSMTEVMKENNYIAKSGDTDARLDFTREMYYASFKRISDI